MATLVSPGVSVTIVNESFYIPAAAPTVPLIFLATRSDKTQADGVTPAAGALEHSIVRQITSLNQSVSTYGVPAFRTLTGVNDGGTPLHGDARNEYGLFALNQALTILSNAYVVRANVDLDDSPLTIFASSTPSPQFTGGSTANGTISIPVLNQATAIADFWTVTANAGAAGITAGLFNNTNAGYVAGQYNGVALQNYSGPSLNGLGATANVTVAGTLAGTDTVNFAGTTVANSTLAGIAGGTYTFKVAVNGNPGVVYSVTATGTDTFQSLASLMTSVSGGLFTVAVNQATPGGFIFSTASLGSTSNIIVTIPAGSGTDLFTAIQSVKAAASVTNAPQFGANGVTALQIVNGGTGYDTDDVETIAQSNLGVLAATSGSATLDFTTSPTVTPTTALLIPAGAYTFRASINGGAAATVSVTATGTDTMTTMAGLLQTALQAQFGAGSVTVTPSGTGWVIASAATGYTSSVFLTIPAGSGTDLVTAIDTYLTATSAVTSAPGIGYVGNSFIQYSITAVAPTTFAVIGTLSGNQGNANVGSLYSNSQLSFTITMGSTFFRAGDAFSFSVSNTGTVTDPLGANDAAKRTTIVTALRAEINGNTSVRSDIYEYNLILCPGYYEVVGDLLNLSLAINEEAFVIGDTPFTNTPEQTATWGSTVQRQISQDVAYYYPHGLAANLDGNSVFVAASGTALKTYAYSDNVSEVWFPPAGPRRGVVTGLQDIGYVTGTLGTATTFVSAPLNQGQRDLLYQYNTNINPIPYLPGIGIVVMGQKTSPSAASALDRVNVMRMMMKLKRDIRKSSFSFLFELNDRITRDSIKQMIDNYLNDIMQRRGLYDFVTICDDSNNTPQRINANELHVDIAISPTKAAEFIYIPIRVVAAGTSLSG